MIQITSRMIAISALLMGVSQLSLSAESLCGRNETTFFSCTTKGGRIVSLCGDGFILEHSDFEANDDSWLQYRFGLPGAIELSYPSRRKNSLDKFQGDWGSALQGSVSWRSIAFVSSGIGYKVEYLVPESQKSFEGVRIGDPKKLDIQFAGTRKASYPQATIPCVGKAHDEKFDGLVRLMGSLR